MKNSPVGKTRKLEKGDTIDIVRGKYRGTRGVVESTTNMYVYVQVSRGRWGGQIVRPAKTSVEHVDDKKEWIGRKRCSKS